MHFALYGRNLGPDAEKRIRVLLEHLSDRGVTVSCYAALAACLRGHGMCCPAGGTEFYGAEDLPEDVDIVISLGGDGTFLSSLTVAGDSGIPVAGINFGRLGFLTSAGSGDAGRSIVDRMIDGDYTVERRTLLEVSCPGLPDGLYPYALNEITLQRSGPFMIGIEVSIDGMHIPTYWADGLLIATPTGSTAYSLSVGGPVVAPGSSVFIVTPIAPHNLNVRPLIVPDTSEVEVIIRSGGHGTVISADNRSADVGENSRTIVRKAPFTLPCVSLGKDGFFEALNEKLLWGEDRRNEVKL